MVGFFLVLGASALWAVDTLIRYPLINKGVGSFSVVFYEHLILSSIFLIIFYKKIPSFFKIPRKHVLYFFIVGAIGSGFSTLAFTKAFHFLNPSLVILLQKFQPVVAISLASVILKERVGPMFILWAIICILGAFLISYDDIINLFSSRANFLTIISQPGSFQGYILVIFSIFGWGSSTVFGKKLLKIGYQDEEVMAGRFILGLVSLLPFIPFYSGLFSHELNVYGNISLMVLVSGLLAMYLYYHGLRKLSARACSLTELSFPFMAVIVNWVFLDAKLTLIQLLGGLLLLLGSIIIQLKRY